MDEEHLMRELGPVFRTLLNAVAQMRERMARQDADRAREAQHAAADQQRIMREQLHQHITAGREIYGKVRDLDWNNPAGQRRIAEAFVTSTALAEHDAVARAAQTYLITELKARHGDKANEWLEDRIAHWQELQRTQDDQRTADREAEQQQERDTEQQRDHDASEPDRSVEPDLSAEAEEVRHQREEKALDRGHDAAEDAHAQNQRSASEETAAKHRESYPVGAATDLNQQSRGPQRHGRTHVRTRARTRPSESPGR